MRSKIYLTLHQLLWILLMIIIFVRRGPSLAGERLLHWKMEEQNAMFQIPLVNLLYDRCLPCFYIVSISTSTTKCFLSPFPFSQNKLDKSTTKKRVAKCMKALNVYFMDNAATLHSYMHDIGGGKVSPLPVNLQPVDIVATLSTPLGFMWHTFHPLEWHPFTSETVIDVTPNNVR